MNDRDTTLSALADATAKMINTVATLADADLRAPSRLPGWTRGHVVAHLARNADSVWNLLEWARCGVEIPQYPSNEARDGGVHGNAGRPAAELLAEVRLSAERLDMQARTMPSEAWESTVRSRSGWGHPAWYTLNRRWREVEAHHADLDAGYTYLGWSAAYVRWELGDTLRALRLDGGLAAGRVRAGDMDVDIAVGAGPDLTGPGHELLGWLTGRGDGSALAGPLPEVPAWPLSPPDWRAQ
jgi:maleylpyruvate isomerase